jgi:hypothetical protein
VFLAVVAADGFISVPGICVRSPGHVKFCSSVQCSDAGLAGIRRKGVWL